MKFMKKYLITILLTLQIMSWYFCKDPEPADITPRRTIIGSWDWLSTIDTTLSTSTITPNIAGYKFVYVFSENNKYIKLKNDIIIETGQFTVEWNNNCTDSSYHWILTLDTNNILRKYVIEVSDTYYLYITDYQTGGRVEEFDRIIYKCN